MSWLIDPFRSDFMVHAAIVGAIVGIVAPVVGVWVVMRRLAYLGDAMSHGTLAGVAFGYLSGIGVVAGALVAGLAMGLGVAWLERVRRVNQDAAIGIVETALFAIGILIIARSDRIGVDLSHFLFGQIITTSPTDIAVNTALAVAVVGTVLLRFGDLRMASFDELHAAQVGIRTDRLRILLFALISVTVVICLDTVGLLMSVALLVNPAAAARLLATTLERMTAIAVGMGVSAAVGGLVASYHLGTPPGPTIALATVGWFGVAWVSAALQRRPFVDRLPVSGGLARR